MISSCCFWWSLVFGIAALLVAVTILVYHKHKKSYGGSSSSHHNPATYLGSAACTKALNLRLTFFCVQKLGTLSADNSINWRGDSVLKDGTDAGLDLSGGMYDAGDHIMFSFPLAFTSTLLSSSGAQMEAAS